MEAQNSSVARHDRWEKMELDPSENVEIDTFGFFEADENAEKQVLWT